ncbi:disease resistance protein (TIR-NBS-LRR class) [Abeliophyllum distichum]|uniref:Disease resistance protein (TIR-NBS-LRR class) n=1 Tax=Abeliophyllum distichum TaxID=126358 RepID=A0ABD1W0A0_9LAMI
MGGCSSRASEVIRKFDKVALRSLRNFSIPGSEIPEWFTRDEVCFSKKKYDAIKSVIIAVVISNNTQIQHDSRYDGLPVIFEVQAKIIRVNMAVFTHTLNLRGIPSTQENQLYLCRYPDYTPLVSILEDGDKIQVVRRDPPYDPRIMLKKSGIHLVYENDDNYDGEEESLNENQHSVTHRLKRFVDSPEEHNNIANSTQEDGNGLHCLECIFGIPSYLLGRCFSLAGHMLETSEDFDF